MVLSVSLTLSVKAGGQEVAGSNPVAPTCFLWPCFLGARLLAAWAAETLGRVGKRLQKRCCSRFPVQGGDLPPLNDATFRERISRRFNPREGMRYHEEKNLRRSRSLGNSVRLGLLKGRPCRRWCESLA